MGLPRVAVGVAALAVVLTGSAALGLATAEERTGTAPAPPAGDARFVVECTPSHRAPDDPIVHPGHAGASHLHDFFGSVATTSTSRGVDLLGTASTCQTFADTAAYWTPVLLHDGDPVEPGRLFAYYDTAAGVDPAGVQPYPLGLAVVAGDPAARGPQPTDVVAWHCGGSAELSDEPVICPRTAPLGLRVRFPSCWDGARLDSPDHRSHVAYPDPRRGCPPSHPVALPELVADVAYAFWGDPAGLSLASGPVWTAHADFLDGWDPPRLAELVYSCLRHGVGCGVAPNREAG